MTVKHALGLVCKRRVYVCPRTRAPGCRALLRYQGSSSPGLSPLFSALMTLGQGGLLGQGWGWVLFPRLGACSQSCPALSRVLPCCAGIAEGLFSLATTFESSLEEQEKQVPPRKGTASTSNSPCCSLRPVYISPAGVSEGIPFIKRRSSHSSGAEVLASFALLSWLAALQMLLAHIKISVIKLCFQRQGK